MNLSKATKFIAFSTNDRIVHISSSGSLAVLILYSMFIKNYVALHCTQRCFHALGRLLLNSKWHKALFAHQNHTISWNSNDFEKNYDGFLCFNIEGTKKSDDQLWSPIAKEKKVSGNRIQISISPKGIHLQWTIVTENGFSFLVRQQFWLNIRMAICLSQSNSSDWFWLKM